VKKEASATKDKRKSGAQEAGASATTEAQPARGGGGAAARAVVMPLPSRRAKDGTLKFADHPDFKPNLAPFQVLQLGSFGGTYWRPIRSAVTEKNYSNQHEEYPAAWFDGLSADQHLTRSWKKYDVSVNKYRVKCGGDLEMCVAAVGPSHCTHTRLWRCVRAGACVCTSARARVRVDRD
jgi:hypothetical protein